MFLWEGQRRTKKKEEEGKKLNPYTKFQRLGKEKKKKERRKGGKKGSVAFVPFVSPQRFLIM